MRPSLKPRDDPDLDAVWTWFEFQGALIAEERGHVVRILSHQTPETTVPLRPHELRFLFLTPPEVKKFFDLQKAQLDLLTMFEILATAEAILRIDFNVRVAARKKDPLTRRFRAIRKANRDKIRLDEHLLRAMQEEQVPVHVISAFRATLKLRHWLAHGQYWHPKMGYTPQDVFDIAKALVDAIPMS